MEIFINHGKVKFRQGVQEFTLEYEGTEEELEWMSVQLNDAFINFKNECQTVLVNSMMEVYKDNLTFGNGIPHWLTEQVREKVKKLHMPMAERSIYEKNRAEAVRIIQKAARDSGFRFTISQSYRILVKFCHY